MPLFDVLIVGGGMVGATLAAALRNRSLRVGIIEQRRTWQDGEFTSDGRASAIAWGTSQIWRQIGVWETMESLGVTPMQRIQISDREFPLQVLLRAEEAGTPCLGYVVENAVTQRALWQAIQEADNIEVLCPATVMNLTPAAAGWQVTLATPQGLEMVEARLLVGADGRDSRIRSLAGIAQGQRSYNQACLVTQVQLGRSHQNVAYERFQDGGPFAILPLAGDRCCVVWTVQADAAEQWRSLGPTELVAALAERFGAAQMAAFASLEVLSPPVAYLPRWAHSLGAVRPGLILIGDAAHATHPVAGQGVNLGIRDAATLAELVEQLGVVDLGRRFQRRRFWDNWGILNLTDSTNRLFSSKFWFWVGLRRVGLLLLQLYPLRWVLMFVMMGRHQSFPRLHPGRISRKLSEPLPSYSEQKC
jgi:2-octaprenyl-6-methoxyphenol hydroxylase